ncbi:unnamed protein product [Adineta ricciae]|uniref:Uncharacterized protein n=1 Tax=Adineta ricciae TaxID=249248 RepID=A0A814UPW0_ADIRI|nr:unnamed protein product [Adineta ricciae]CAF1567572.1 unnamed protein product [Adineta ricciae]
MIATVRFNQYERLTEKIMTGVGSEPAPSPSPTPTDIDLHQILRESGFTVMALTQPCLTKEHTFFLDKLYYTLNFDDQNRIGSVKLDNDKINERSLYYVQFTGRAYDLSNISNKPATKELNY